MDLVGLTDLLSDIGALGVSALIIWALLTGRVVPRGQVDELRTDRDRIQAELDVERARHER